MNNQNGFLDTRKQLSLSVKYALSNDFRSLAESIEGVVVTNVVELKANEVLHYTLLCPHDKQNEVTELGFMTWIRNPVFQKFYSGCSAFAPIAEEFLQGYMHKVSTFKDHEVFTLDVKANDMIKKHRASLNLVTASNRIDTGDLRCIILALDEMGYCIVKKP